MAYNFVTTCCDKNAIRDSMIRKRKRIIFCMMMWHVISHHTNLGPHISMSQF
jgi:hypothetical protein